MPQNNAAAINVAKCLGTCCRGGEPLLTGLATLGLAAKRTHKAHLSADQALQVFNLISPTDIPSTLTGDDANPAPTEPAPGPRPSAPGPRRRRSKKVGKKAAKKKARRSRR